MTRSYPDYVVLPYARHLRLHPDRSADDRKTDEDLRLYGRLPTSLCSDARRDALRGMGFRAETTSRRLLHEARLRASAAVLAGLADPVEGVHDSQTLAKFTAPTGGDGDHPLRRDIRDRLADLTHQEMVSAWTARNGVPHVTPEGVPCPAMSVDDFDNANNEIRALYAQGETLLERFAAQAEKEARVFGEAEW